MRHGDNALLRPAPGRYGCLPQLQNFPQWRIKSGNSPLADLMTVAVARYLGFQHRTDARQKLTALLVAFAFALQCFFTQTHIHGSAQTFGSVSIVKSVANDPIHGKAPADDSPLDCPYCQAVAHSGAFFMPAAPLLRLPGVRTERAALAVAFQAIKSTARLNWRSRAPPPQ